MVKNTKRLSVNLPLKSYEKLVAVADHTHHTLSEVVRQGLSLIELAVQEKQRGHVIYTGTKEGEILKELVILE